MLVRMSETSDDLQAKNDDAAATGAPPVQPDAPEAEAVVAAVAVAPEAATAPEAAVAAAPPAPTGGASEWTLRIMLGGMMFLLLLCAIFIAFAS